MRRRHLLALTVPCNIKCLFDPLTLIAPVSLRFIRQQYKEACHGMFASKQIRFVGQTKSGLKIPCQAFLLVIPYKWAVAIQGMLRTDSAARRSEGRVPPRHGYLPVAFDAAQRAGGYSDKNTALS